MAGAAAVMGAGCGSQPRSEPTPIIQPAQIKEAHIDYREAFVFEDERPHEAAEVPVHPGIAPALGEVAAAAASVGPASELGEPGAAIREPTVRVWSRAEIIAELSRYDWPIEGAIATVQCESGFDQFARNASGARGVFQDINDDPAVDDPAVAIYRGYLKWLDGGRSFWRHWTQWGGCGAGW